MYLDSVVDLVKVDPVSQLKPLSHLQVIYLHGPDLSLFIWALIYSLFSRVLHVLLYSFIHATENETKLHIPLSFGYVGIL